MIKTDIFDAIQWEVVKSRGSNCMLSRKYIILELLEKLRPDKPKDGSVGKIAYDVPGKERMKLKVGRFLTRKLNLNNSFLSDKSIASITHNINTRLFSGDVVIRLVSSDDITECYRNAVGASSCMTGGDCEKTRLYEANPDRFRMLTMYYMNDSSRAIVHKLDNGGYFMDRVYASCGLLIDSMRDYALEHDWAYRLSVDADDRAVSCDHSDLVVSDLEYEDGQVPFMDTLQHGCTCGNGLSISLAGCCDYELSSTTGYIKEQQLCANCGFAVDEDDFGYGSDEEVYCESCFADIFAYCDKCSDVMPRDDAVEITDVGELVCQDCASNKYNRCVECGDYLDEAYNMIEGDCVCNGCSESFCQCVGCGEWSYDSESLDDDEFCCDCRKKKSEVKDHVGQRRLDL